MEGKLTFIGMTEMVLVIVLDVLDGYTSERTSMVKVPYIRSVLLDTRNLEVPNLAVDRTTSQ